MGVVSNRLVSACGTSIRRPFRRPLRTWRACSSPRLTRCNTVWRETPRARIASNIGTYPGGASSTNRAEFVVDTDPPRRAGGVLLAADDPVTQPAVDRGGGDAELFGGSCDGEQFAVGRLVGRVVGGDVAIAAQAADDDRGEPLAGGGASALAVEDPGDRAVVVVHGKPLEEFDGVFVGADRGLVARQGDGELGERAAVPADRDGRLVVIAVDVEDDFLDQAAQQLFAV